MRHGALKQSWNRRDSWSVFENFNVLSQRAVIELVQVGGSLCVVT